VHHIVESNGSVRFVFFDPKIAGAPKVESIRTIAGKKEFFPSRRNVAGGRSHTFLKVLGAT
jgi:hypothetical protein